MIVFSVVRCADLEADRSGDGTPKFNPARFTYA